MVEENVYNVRMERETLKTLKTQNIREIRVATPPPNAHRVSFGCFMCLKRLRHLAGGGIGVLKKDVRTLSR